MACRLGPNVLPVLARFGLEEAARRAAYLPDDLLCSTCTRGETLVRIPLGRAFDARYPAPLHRHPPRGPA